MYLCLSLCIAFPLCLLISVVWPFFLHFLLDCLQFFGLPIFVFLSWFVDWFLASVVLSALLSVFSTLSSVLLLRVRSFVPSFFTHLSPCSFTICLFYWFI